MKCLVASCPNDGLERGLYGLCAEHQSEVAERRKELDERVREASNTIVNTVVNQGNGYVTPPTVSFVPGSPDAFTAADVVSSFKANRRLPARAGVQLLLQANRRRHAARAELRARRQTVHAYDGTDAVVRQVLPGG